MKIFEFCKVLDEKLAGATPDEVLRLSALALQQAFKVEEDEIVFLSLDPETNSLYFIWPIRMSNAGSIPMSTHGSFVTGTVREQRPQIHNRFTSAQHASIFEQFKLGNPKDKKDKKDKKDNRPKTIQKIMSVPLIEGENSVGAVQVCRKGETDDQAGADFTKTELEALTEIAKVIARNI